MDGKTSLERAKPRIAVFTKPLDNWTSGSGHHLNEILEAVLDFAGDRFEFTFVHYKPSGNPIYKRVRELVVPHNPLLSARVLRKERFDLVHYSPLTINSPIWGIRSKKVATIHGAEQLLVPQFFGKIELAHEYFVIPVYVRRMDGIVTVSNTSARFFVDRYRVEPERIVVCYNGLGPAYRVLDKADITAPERYRIEGPFILHVSRFSERKNPWTLLEAFARLVEKSEAPLSLVCAGGRWDDETVLDRAQKLGIAERLVTPGFVPEGDVVELMNAASAFVFPSLAEGFGMPNVEAMACGCPVVTTPGFAVREIVGDAALVVEDPGDPVALSEALHRVLSDESLRSELVRRGFARLPLFSWEDAARKLVELYDRLIADSR
jgi:glycosyltransferase involved in cell wall biosynthesis